MNIQVKKDFGFLDINNKTTITLNIIIMKDSYHTLWTSDQVLRTTPDNKDYAIIGGKIVICFKKNNIQIGNDFFLDILGQPNIGFFASALPNRNEISIKDFNQNPKFMIGQFKNNIKIGENIVQYLKLDSNIVKSIETILLYSNQKIAIIIKKINARHDNFTKGDSLKVKIKVGEIEFPNEYTLTL